MLRRRTQVLTFLSNYDIRILALIQINIILNYAIRGNGCYSSILHELDFDGKEALFKLEKYLEFLIRHFGIVMERDSVLNYCKGQVSLIGQNFKKNSDCVGNSIYTVFSHK